MSVISYWSQLYKISRIYLIINITLKIHSKNSIRIYYNILIFPKIIVVLINLIIIPVSRTLRRLLKRVVSKKLIDLLRLLKLIQIIINKYPNLIYLFKKKI